MTQLVAGLVLAAGVAIAAPAFAHHSFAVYYLEQDTIEIEGEVVEFQYKNPHAVLFVEGNEKADIGAPKVYAAEWVSVAQLTRAEIPKNFFKPGERIRIWASPNKNPMDNRVRLKRMERQSDHWKWGANPRDTR